MTAFRRGIKWGRLRSATLAFGLALGNWVRGADSATILWRTNAPKVSVEVRGLDAALLRDLAGRHLAAREWQRIFPVTVEQESIRADLNVPPMAGRYELTNSAVVFQPSYPFEPGVYYQAHFAFKSTTGLEATGSGRLFLAAKKGEPSTVLSEIYPTAAVLPENLLKFYLCFSAPMSRGQIYEHIHLLDEKGRQVELPFLEIEEELWNPAMTRLTLFLDPGRIKRGVRPLEEVGPALAAGKRYTLRIDADWRDAAGQRLKTGFEKNFRVIPPDRDPPDPEEWKINAPHAGTRDPLVITFNKPMDYALAQRMIRVLDPKAGERNGTKGLSDNERVWKFEPVEPWHAGMCEVAIQTTIEDLAGNNVGRPFEVDLAEAPREVVHREIVKREIRIE